MEQTNENKFTLSTGETYYIEGGNLVGKDENGTMRSLVSISKHLLLDAYSKNSDDKLKIIKAIMIIKPEVAEELSAQVKN
jgi:hypothetical protein